MSRTIPIELECSISPVVELEINAGAAVELTCSSPIEIHPTTDPVPIWDGATTFTPAAQAQTVEVQGYRFVDNITIEAIPSNWGRITWNGSALTVS